ncbi:unnamed protein product, partial [marine sediment metagenome]
TASDWIGVVYAVVALIVLLLAGLGVMALARRYVLHRPQGKRDGLDLQKLRDLLADGKISQEEYNHLREQVIGRFRAARKGNS